MCPCSGEERRSGWFRGAGGPHSLQQGGVVEITEIIAMIWSQNELTQHSFVSAFVEQTEKTRKNEYHVSPVLPAASSASSDQPQSICGK